MDEFLNRFPIASFEDVPAGAQFFILAILAFEIFRFLRAISSRHFRRSERRRWIPRVIRNAAETNVADPKWQMEFISRVDFEPQPLLNKSEYQVLLLLEAVVQDLHAGFRVMAQTSLGEILRTKRSPWMQGDADLAYRAINSKRADFVVINRRGLPVLVVEYQGHGHYRGNAVLRDAVKREAFRKASVTYLEVPAEYHKAEVVRAVRRILERHSYGRSRQLPS